MKSLLVAPLVGALLLWSCGVEAPVPAGSGAKEELSASPGSSLVPIASPADVAHAGERVVEVWDRSVFPPAYTGFRESILTDGAGRFSVDPVAPLTGGQPGWAAFRDMQRSRAGFVFRYRDFAVRDEALFFANYALTDLGATTVIAGRNAVRYRVERIVGTAIAFELAVDEATSLVLEALAFDENGDLLSSVRYETFDDTPDLEGAIWHQTTNQEKDLEWREPLAPQLGVNARVPRLSPPGFRLRAASTVIDSDGDEWLKLTYVDGVEPLFFMWALPEVSSGNFGSQVDPLELTSADEVVLFRLGPAGAAQGTVGGERYMVVGKVPDDELLDLIESALP